MYIQHPTYSIIRKILREHLNFYTNHVIYSRKNNNIIEFECNNYYKNNKKCDFTMSYNHEHFVILHKQHKKLFMKLLCSEMFMKF